MEANDTDFETLVWDLSFKESCEFSQPVAKCGP